MLLDPDVPGAGSCQRIVSPCTADAMCPTSTRCESGRCVPVVAPDEPCGPDAMCPGTQACIEGTCVARPLLGEACVAGARCLSGACIDGVCRWVDPGARCEPTECEGFCDLDGGCAPTGGEPPSCTSSWSCAEGRVCVLGGALGTCADVTYGW